MCPVVAFLFPTGWLSFAWFLCVDWSLVVCVSRIQLNYTVSFQLCDPADYLWTMELHSDYEGLHRPRPNGSYPAKHQHSAGPETLGGAEDGWVGRKNGPSGDWLLLGNRSAVTKWKPEIWSYHQGVRDTERFMVIKPVFVVAGQFLSCLVFLFLSSCPNPADQTVKVEGNGLGTGNYFSFNMFQFSGKTGDVYLHCRLELCVRQGNNCEPVCIQFLDMFT